MDRWDIAGLAGVLLMDAGIWGLAGPWWAAIFAGGVLLGLYGVREIRRI